MRKMIFALIALALSTLPSEQHKHQLPVLATTTPWYSLPGILPAQMSTSAEATLATPIPLEPALTAAQGMQIALPFAISRAQVMVAIPEMSFLQTRIIWVPRSTGAPLIR
jgi:hypothetical protein